MGGAVRVLLADDHRLFGEAIRAMLERQAAFEVACVDTIEAAVSTVQGDSGFDIVLMDLRMPGVDGLDGLRLILDAGGACPVAILSGHVDRDLAEQAFGMGAAGVVPKSASPQALQHAINIMIAGERYLPPDLFGAPLPHDERQQRAPGRAAAPSTAGLTGREAEVLDLLVEGLSNKDIARRLGIGPMTVAQHLTAIFRKLAVTSRTQAVSAALLARERDRKRQET